MKLSLTSSMGSTYSMFGIINYYFRVNTEDIKSYQDLTSFSQDTSRESLFKSINLSLLSFGSFVSDNFIKAIFKGSSSLLFMFIGLIIFSAFLPFKSQLRGRFSLFSSS